MKPEASIFPGYKFDLSHMTSQSVIRGSPTIQHGLQHALRGEPVLDLRVSDIVVQPRLHKLLLFYVQPGHLLREVCDDEIQHPRQEHRYPALCRASTQVSIQTALAVRRSRSREHLLCSAASDNCITITCTRTDDEHPSPPPQAPRAIQVPDRARQQAPERARERRRAEEEREPLLRLRARVPHRDQIKTCGEDAALREPEEEARRDEPGEAPSEALEERDDPEGEHAERHCVCVRAGRQCYDALWGADSERACRDAGLTDSRHEAGTA